ncbi:MAG: S-layer homology domain-containing protein [Candidatus Pristimantibacillus sp.]
MGEASGGFAVQAGIINGYKDGSFRANARMPVQRWRR